jgi:pimeloyl-ACP methyl ester carboxylesterase
MSVAFYETSVLRIACKTSGDTQGFPIFLVHGWPDDSTTFDCTISALNDAGYRTFAPWLRGCGETVFRSSDTMRSGEIAAMAQDLIDLADLLDIDRFAVVGHDWGARIAYLLGSVFPERIVCIAALSLGWQPGPLATPRFEQAQAFWYQWFLATDRGADAVRNKGKEFARFQWETWSPPGWFDANLFDQVSQSFENPDWPEITIHSYRVRWGEANPDPRYAELTKKQVSVQTITVPTLVIHGLEDRVVLPQSSEEEGKYFSGFYSRHLLEGVGHFPTREAPNRVASLVVPFLNANLRETQLVSR